MYICVVSALEVENVEKSSNVLRLLSRFISEKKCRSLMERAVSQNIGRFFHIFYLIA